jgi:hypothetical protein
MKAEKVGSVKTNLVISFIITILVTIALIILIVNNIEHWWEFKQFGSVVWIVGGLLAVCVFSDITLIWKMYMFNRDTKR